MATPLTILLWIAVGIAAMPLLLVAFVLLLSLLLPLIQLLSRLFRRRKKAVTLVVSAEGLEENLPESSRDDSPTIPPPNITETNMASITITQGRRRRVVITPTTDNGAPAPVDGGIMFDGMGTDITSAPVADAPLKLWLEARGSIGTKQVKLSADANLGAEVETIEVIIDVEVIARRAKNLGFAVEGDEEDIPTVIEPPVRRR